MLPVTLFFVKDKELFEKVFLSENLQTCYNLLIELSLFIYLGLAAREIIKMRIKGVVL